jgi:hypothetical protein
MMAEYSPRQRLQIIKAGQLSVDCLKDKPDVNLVHQMTKIILEAGGETVEIFTSNREPEDGKHFQYVSEKSVPGTKPEKSVPGTKPEKSVPGTKPEKSETRSFSGRNYDDLFCKGPKTPWEIMLNEDHKFFEFVHTADGKVVFIVHPGEVVKVTKGPFEKRKEIAQLLNKKFCRVIYREVDSDDYPKFYAADPVKEEFLEMMKRTSMLMIDGNKFFSQILLIAMGSSTAFVGLFDDVHDLILSIQNIEGAKQEKISVIYRDEDHEEGLYGTKIVMSASQMLTLAKVKAE